MTVKAKEKVCWSKKLWLFILFNVRLASYIIAYFILEMWHFVYLSLPDVLTLTTMILVFLKIAAFDSYDFDEY